MRLKRFVIIEKITEGGPFPFTINGARKCGKFIHSIGGIEALYVGEKPWFSLDSYSIISSANALWEKLSNNIKS